MRIHRWVARTAVFVGLAALPFAAFGATIEPGQTRVVEGKISAVDAANRAVVVQVPGKGGGVTVGVTLDASVTPKIGGKPAKLEDVAVGHRVRLKYTRKDGELRGVDLNVLR